MRRATSPPRSQRRENAAGQRRRASLYEIALVLRRNVLLLLICMGVVPLAALLLSLVQNPQYTASASLLFAHGVSAPVFDPAEDSERAAATNVELVTLTAVSARTAEQLDRPELTAGVVEEKVTISPDTDSDLVTIEAVDPDPELAADVANTFAAEFVALRSEQERSLVDEAQALVEQQLSRFSPEQLDSPQGSALYRQARDLQLLAPLQGGSAELVEKADPPTESSSPKPVLSIALGPVLGLALGIGLILLREQLDQRLKDIGEVQSVLDLPVLAGIPASRAIARRGASADRAVVGAEADAFQLLRANLRYLRTTGSLRSVLITSVNSGDGKTTVSWNLAMAEARAGRRVLLIEADLRAPTLTAELGVASPQGLSHVLAGVLEPEDAIRGVLGADVLLAGPVPPNPGELVASDRMRDLIHWAEETYEQVIVDSPPSVAVADTLSLMEEVSGVAVVVRLGRSRRDDAQRLRDQLARFSVPVVGLIVNGSRSRADHYYYESTLPAVEDGPRSMATSTPA